MMVTCAIVGVNWGDEGKGRMVDFLAEQYDVVVRYQGGNNAGHTVINEFGESKLNLIPSGIFRPETVNLLGAGTVIDLKHIDGEIANLRQKGVTITPDNLKISDRAIMVLPFHPLQDALEEQRLGKAGYGSTKRGIAPVYGDKYMKKAIQMGDLLHPESLKKHLKQLVEWKNAVFANAYQQPPISYEETLAWIEQYGAPLRPHIVDAFALLESANAAGKNILFEAQLGAMRDIDYGIYPYTSSSSPLSAYAPVGSGCPALKVDRTVGVVKAYSTCVGQGPFVGELFGEAGDALREAGQEYGAATGRPRRVAWIDLVATRYGAKLQAATEIVLTKLDVLSYLKEIPVCIAYRKANGEVTHDFPYTSELDGCEPVYDFLPGWDCDISGARTYEELPEAARCYVERIEREIGCHISYVSVGAQRDALIRR